MRATAVVAALAIVGCGTEPAEPPAPTAHSPALLETETHQATIGAERTDDAPPAAK